MLLLTCAEASKPSWRWRRGDYFSQSFQSETDARMAEEDCSLDFSRPDGGDALKDLLVRRSSETGYHGPYDFWLIDEFVSEPSIGGEQLGEIPFFTVPKDAKVLIMTQAEFDTLLDDYYLHYGMYPND